jgi:peptidoglycan hydrolase CwlO-like protein
VKIDDAKMRQEFYKFCAGNVVTKLDWTLWQAAYKAGSDSQEPVIKTLQSELVPAHKEIARLKEEVERLEAVAEEWKDTSLGLNAELRQRDEEIARLKEEIEQLKRDVEIGDGGW